MFTKGEKLVRTVTALLASNIQSVDEKRQTQVDISKFNNESSFLICTEERVAIFKRRFSNLLEAYVQKCGFRSADSSDDEEEEGESES